MIICIYLFISIHNLNGCVNVHVHIQFLKIFFYFGNILKFISNMEFKTYYKKKLQNINQSFGYKSHTTMPNEVLIKR